MEEKTILYHGSNLSIITPEVRTDKYAKDFGNGFYCTTIRKQAERWAGRYKTPVLNVYEYQENERLTALVFKEMTEEWLDFVVACRAWEPHGYDIVEGPMADDQIYNYVADYISGVITREQFWALAKFKHPTHQIAFCTAKSLKCITFKDSIVL